MNESVHRIVGVAALALCLAAPVLAAAQEANMSTTVASLGSGVTMSRINIDALKPRSATDRGLALPSLSVTDDGSGPWVRNLVLELPDLELDSVSVSSRAGDQPLPAVFRAAPLAGWALSSPVRGLTLTTTGSAPLSVSFGQMPVAASSTQASGSPALAAAAMSLNPSARLSVTPQAVMPSGSPGAQTSVGTAIRAKVVDNVTVVTDVGMAGRADAVWAPLASARVVAQWPRAGIETSVLRGTPAPIGANSATVVSRDREAALAQVQPLPGLTLAALTSLSRPSADSTAVDTTLGSLRVAFDGLRSGQVAAFRQREATASRESDVTSLEWRQRGPGKMAVRYVRQRSADSALDGVEQGSSRVEIDLPTMATRCAGCPDLRAAVTAGSSQAATGVNSKVSGRVALIDDTALTGETELGLASRDGQVLRAFRLTTDLPVVQATRLQLSYAYRNGQQFPLGQVFEARILRRVSLGW